MLLNVHALFFFCSHLESVQKFDLLSREISPQWNMSSTLHSYKKPGIFSDIRLQRKCFFSVTCSRSVSHHIRRNKTSNTVCTSDGFRFDRIFVCSNGPALLQEESNIIFSTFFREHCSRHFYQTRCKESWYWDAVNRYYNQDGNIDKWNFQSSSFVQYAYKSITL